MNNRRLIIRSFLVCALFLNACSSDYTPQKSADGAAIFNAACSECHQVVSEATPEMFFTLHSKNANSTYIEFKVYNGSINMPKFPNIKGHKMKILANYVLDHSLRK